MVTKTKQSASSRMQEEVTVHQQAALESSADGGIDTSATISTLSLEDITTLIQANVQSAYEKFLATPQEEVAEPLLWWDLYAWGPYQPGAQMVPPSNFTGPLQPNEVIRVGEYAYVATVLVLNTTFPSTGLSAAEVLSSFALPYRVEYGTGELKRWQPGPAYLQHAGQGNLTPHVPYAIDIFGFRPQDEGLFEMNISARIFGCDENIAPPFAGFATKVVNLDSDMFGIRPRVQQDIPIRFQVYR